MNPKKVAISFGKAFAWAVLVIMLAGLTLVVMIVLNPSMFPEWFAQVITVQISAVALGVFAMINFLVITYFLYSSYNHTKIVLQNAEKQQQIDSAKNDLISLVSHQLRTPISAVNWYTEALLHGDQGELSQDQQQYVSAIRESNQRMIVMVDSILNASRIEMKTFALEPQDFEVTKLFQETLADFGQQFQVKNITLNKNLAEDLGSMHSDAKYVRLILENLISNALKYTPAGGSIALAAHADRGEIIFSVTDTGYGIPEKDFPRVFSKLFRSENILDKDTDGTGIGLFIVKSIVVFMGGSIRFESTEGEGTTFFVTLPRKISDHVSRRNA